MIKVLADRPKIGISFKSIWGGYRTARRLARLVAGQDRTIIFRPQRIAEAIPQARRLMDSIKDRGGKKILIEPNSTPREIFGKLYRFARRGASSDDNQEFEIGHICEVLSGIDGKRDADLELYVRELVEIRSKYGNNSSISLLANAVIDFRGDFHEDDRMIGLKINDEVRLTPNWLGRLKTIFTHPQTRRAFKEFIKDYHYGFTFPTRLAPLAAVIGNMLLGRGAFNREILQKSEKFQCDTIRFDPHFGTILEEIGLKIPFQPRDPKKLRILDIGCGTSAIGSLTLKYMLDILKETFKDQVTIEATGIDINYPLYGLYPHFEGEGKRLGKLEVYDFDRNGEVEIGGIKYLDAGLPQFNITSQNFNPGEGYDLIICSMLLLDVPEREKAIMLENLEKLIPPGGVLFLNSTSKEDVRSWECFEIYTRSRETGEVRVLDQIVPFEEDPYTHKFQVDYIAEGEILLSRRQYVKRKNNLLNGHKMLISLAIEFAKKCQKRGSSVWGRILEAQKLALQGKSIQEVLLEITREVNDPQFKMRMDAFVSMGESMRVVVECIQKLEKRLQADEALNYILWAFLETNGEEIDPEVTGEIMPKLKMPIDDNQVAFEAATTCYFPNVFSRALRISSWRSSDIEDFIASAKLKDKKLDKIIREYIDALGKIKALVYMFNAKNGRIASFNKYIIKMLIRFPAFPDFRDERFEILRLFVFSRYLNFFQDEFGPFEEEIFEIEHILAPLAEYLGNPVLANKLKELYSSVTHWACRPKSIDPQIFDKIIMSEYVFYRLTGDKEGDGWGIKELPKGTQLQDLKAIFGNGFSYKTYNLDWDYEQRKAILTPLALDGSESLKTGMVVIMEII
ncbi:MAG: class I SAM-dependent methyltransferase [Candidatus Margulisiibacteriota bacterium]